MGSKREKSNFAIAILDKSISTFLEKSGFAKKNCSNGNSGKSGTSSRGKDKITANQRDGTHGLKPREDGGGGDKCQAKGKSENKAQKLKK